MKKLLTVISFTIMTFQVFSQSSNSSSIAVTYDKTTHVIFSSRILYVDLGSESIMASVIDNIPNILRLKAAEKNFSGETNLSVILEDNSIYNFNVHYSDSLVETTIHPEIKSVTKKDNSLCKEIYDRNTDIITSIGYQSHAISALIKSIYITDSSLFINIEIRNRSRIPYTLESTKFSVGNKKNKYSSEELSVLGSYVPVVKVEPHQRCHMVYEFQRFTLPDRSSIQISVLEKSGSRHLIFQVDGRLFTRSIEKL